MLPLLVAPAPSRRLRAATLALHALAGVALAWTDLPASLAIGGGAALLFSAAWHLRVPQVRMLRCGRDGALHVRAGDDWQRLTLLPSTTVLPALTVLQVREGGRRRTIVILADSLPPEDFRRLRVWLRWLARVGTEPQPATP